MSRATRYQPLHASTIADPFRAFREIAKETPIFWHEPMRSWVALRHPTCQEVLRNNDLFARDPRRVGLSVNERRLNIQVEDPPDSSGLRRDVMRALHAQDIDGITRRGVEQLEAKLSALRSIGPVDLMPIAAQSAMDVINEVLGSMEYDAESYTCLFRDLTRAMDSGLDTRRLNAGIKASEELSRRVETWFTAEAPAGMIAALRSNESTASMPIHYVHNTMAGVFNAGFSTLFASTGSVVELLAHRNDVLEEFLEPSVCVTGTHELLRYLSPAQATSRYALVDLDLDGARIKSGQTVVAMMAAANRDPSVFDSPDDIDLRRNPNPHLAFAWGPHVCLGAQLALSWIEKVAQMMARADWSIRLDGNPEYMDTATLRNLTTLPISIN